MKNMKRIDGPVYYIQSDWEDIICKAAGEVWISCKNKDRISRHGKVVRIKTGNDALNLNTSESSISVTEDFTAKLLTHNAIQIGSVDSQLSYIFVAPRSMYNNVHERSITSFDVSEGSTCVSVSSDRETDVVVWLADTQDQLTTFSQHVGAVYKCRWFPSGRVVLSSGADMVLKIWCSETGKCPVTLKGHIKAITDVAFVDRGGNIVSVSKDGSCKLWNCGEARCIDNIAQLESEVNCCSISTAPRNAYLPKIETSRDGEIGTSDKIILIGCENGELRCIAIAARKTLYSVKLDSAINCSSCIAAGLFVVGCQNGDIYTINMSKSFNEPNLTCWTETNSPALCALGYKNMGFFVGHRDGSCVYRSVTDLDCPIRLALTGSNNDPIYDIRCDDKFLYTACRDSVIRKYSPDSYIDRHFT